MTRTSLLTDRYELTMADAALADGTGTRRVTFEAYCRSLPDGVDLGIAAGMSRLIQAVDSFRFGEEELAYLAGQQILSVETLEWLRDFRFGGDLTLAPEGSRFDADVPVLTVDGSFVESVVLETLILSILNSGCTIATHAAAIRRAAGRDPTLIEMGSRRTHEFAAVDAAYAAYVGGFDATSNLESGRRYGIPTAGTAAHAWTLLHDDEVAAFVSQMRTLGTATTLLVDTFDSAAGIRNAVAAAEVLGEPGPGAIRLDSGDLDTGSKSARALLDELGASKTAIVVSGDLDAAEVRRLRGARAPIDAYGVGTRLVAAPPLGFVYKLVAVEGGDGVMRPVAKLSDDATKSTTGGRKVVGRNPDGQTFVADPREEKAEARVCAIERGALRSLPPEFDDPEEARRIALSVILLELSVNEEE